MRVLFIPFPSPPHLFFMTPLAWACRAAGHEVRVAGHPHLTETTLRTGLSPVEVGGDGAGRRRHGPAVTQAGLARTSGDERHRLLDRRFAPMVDLAGEMAPGLVRFADRWEPQIVVADSLAFAAPLVSAALGIPLLRHLTGPDVMHRTIYPMHGPITGDEYSPNWPEGLRELFEEFGVAIHNDHSLGSIDPWPGSIQVPDAHARIPVRHIPYHGAAPSPEWAWGRAGRPRVCLSWGEPGDAARAAQSPALPRILDALTRRDVEVVVTGSGIDRDRLGALPETVRVAGDVPADVVLSTCDAVVSEGGTHTILTAAALGVPQVLVPLVERPPNAATFCESGAGITLDAGDADPEAVGRAVDAVLGDERIRAAARRIQDEIAEAPSPVELVHTLEKLA
ncbi:nucleotide disphospho-sugar-binding domain-containing protein [Micromonospora sp. PTRAS2]